MTNNNQPKPDIIAVLESYGVHVRGTYGWIPVCCPFHGDTNASASVNPDYGKFYCHGCEVRGDAWDLIQEREGCDLKEAIEIGKEFPTSGPLQEKPVRNKAYKKTYTPLGRRGRV